MTKNITAPDARLSDLQRRILVHARRRMIEKGQPVRWEVAQDEAGGIPVYLAAPDWLVRALTDALTRVFRTRRLHIDEHGNITDGHPWFRFFDEIIKVEQAVKEAAKAVGVNRGHIHLLDLYALAEGASVLRLAIALPGVRLVSHPWPYIENDRFVFRVTLHGVSKEWIATQLSDEIKDGKAWFVPGPGAQQICTIPEMLRDLYGFPVVDGGYIDGLAFSPEEIGKARYNNAQAALRRACDRVCRRKLIEMRHPQSNNHWQSHGTYGRTSIGLTEDGVTVADAILAAEQATKVA